MIDIKFFVLDFRKRTLFSSL